MLRRPNLQYHPSGHPILSARAIEEYAEGFLAEYFPSHLPGPSPLRAAALISLVGDQDGVRTADDDLGLEGLRKCLGRMYLKRKLIVLDRVLFAERQISLPFVMAHEFAHWLLHRDCEIAAIKLQEKFPDDSDEAENPDKLDSGWTSLQFIEWQASKFAAALLIPKMAAIRAIYSVQTDLSIPLRKGVIYENTTAGGRAESEQQLELVAKIFEVSKTVTRIRLADLSLYHQQTPKSRPASGPGNHFSQLGKNIRS